MLAIAARIAEIIEPTLPNAPSEPNSVFTDGKELEPF